jgi:hypothetical protein
MEYQDFIKILEQGATKRIKPLSLPTSCSLSRIPEAFSRTFPSIISVLNDNLKKLCPNKNQVIAIYSLQPATLAIWSKTPCLGRIIDPRNPQYHFTCVLSYMLAAKEKLKNITTWASEDIKNIAVDFTSGEIMDQNYYFRKANCPQFEPGIIYGYFDPRELTIAWDIFNKTSRGLPYGLPMFNKNLY